MKTESKNRYREYMLLAVVGAIALFMIFTNLGNQYLWQDEAETALVSKTILTSGIPKGYDGRNYFSQQMGADYNENYVWKWHPWLQFYLLAPFFKVFGESTLVARLPFAIFGFLTVILAYFFSKLLWDDRKAAFAAALLLTFSVPFLLLVRQCRYYSLAMFFSLLSLYSYSNIIKGKRLSSIIFFVSMLLLFHTNFVYWAAMVATAGVHSLVLYRSELKRVTLLIAGNVAINLPWLIWFSSTKYDKANSMNMTDAIANLSSFLVQIKDHLFNPYLLLIPIAVGMFFIVKSNRLRLNEPAAWKSFIILPVFILINLMVLSLSVPASFFRYLAPLIPVLLIIVAGIVSLVSNINLVAGIILGGVIIFSGPIPDYLYEITHDYDGPIEGIVRYLNNYGKKDDVVAVTYGDLPTKFYTGMRIVGGLTGEDLSLAKEADWVIMRKHTICEKDNAVRRYFIKNIPRENYEMITINYPDIPFENRESPYEHHYRTVQDENRVVIYKRIR